MDNMTLKLGQVQLMVGRDKAENLRPGLCTHPPGGGAGGAAGDAAGDVLLPL